MTLHQNRLG